MVQSDELASVEKGSEAGRWSCTLSSVCLACIHSDMAHVWHRGGIGAVTLSEKVHAAPAMEGTPLTRALSGWPGGRQGCSSHMKGSGAVERIFALALQQPRLSRGAGPAQQISCCSSKPVQMLIQLLFFCLRLVVMELSQNWQGFKFKLTRV